MLQQLLHDVGGIGAAMHLWAAQKDMLSLPTAVDEVPSDAQVRLAADVCSLRAADCKTLWVVTVDEALKQCSRVLCVGYNFVCVCCGNSSHRL